MRKEYEEQGSERSGFASDGPYNCDRCVHLRGEGRNESSKYCIHPKVAADPELKWRRNKDGFVKIFNDEKECCRFVKIGKKKSNLVQIAAQGEK